MSILNAFLIENCSEEQANMLIQCFDTLSRIGLVEIEFNIDEILNTVENEDLFSVIQACYEKVRKFQNLAFDSLEIKVNNREDIAAPNELLLYLDQLENFNDSKRIVDLIDQSQTPEDALFALLEQVLYVDTTQMQSIIEEVPTSLMERLYNAHQNGMDIIEVAGRQLKALDERKLNLLKKHWNMGEMNPLKTYVLTNEINLPIKKSVWDMVMKKEITHPMFSTNKPLVARKLLEACLVTAVQWKDIKRAMKQLATQLFEDPLYRAQLSYEIDNICMAENINETL